MSIVEYDLLIVSLITLFVYSYYIQSEKNFNFSIIVTVTAIPVLFFLIERSTSFLTVDETYIIRETINLRESILRQWNSGCLRTTDLIIGPVFSILNEIIDFSKNVNLSKIIAKALHWYIGFLLILYIHFLMDKHFLKNENRELTFIFFLFLLLLFPANSFALVIFNYDLYSMLFAAIGIIYLSVSITDQDKKAALKSLIFCFLAAQEKLNASPLMPVSVFICVYSSYRNSNVFCSPGLRQRLAFLLLRASAAVGITLLLSVSAYLIAGIARWGAIPPLKYLAYPLTLWTWPLIHRFAVQTDGLICVYVLLGEVIGSVIGSEIIRVIELLLKQKNRMQVAADFFHKYSDKILLALFISVFTISVITTYTQVRLAGPIIPPSPGHYQPPSFNNIYIHFDAPDMLSHTFRYVLSAYAVFFNALPTALILLLIYCLSALKNRSSFIWYIIGFGILAAPLLYGLTLTPVGIRYLNIPLLFFPLFVLYLFDKIIINKKYRIIAVIVTILAVFSEIVPFRPVFAGFRPVWSEYYDEFNSRPSVGKYGFTWPGWGEELMLAGKKIEQMCFDGKIKCDDIRLYYLNIGEWLDPKIPVEILHIESSRPGLRFTENDYYVFNRDVVILNAINGLDKLLANTRPFFTIDFRGNIQAWVFRGDQFRLIIMDLGEAPTPYASG